MNKRGILLIGILLLTIPFAMAVERGDYWNKYDKGLGAYNLEVYSGIVNYNSGSGYEPFEYGICGVDCFRDNNGLIYRISGDPNKSYINLHDIDNNYISSFGFGITGTVGAVNYTYTTLNFTWIWSGEYNSTTQEYVFYAWNNKTNFNWTQEYYFYSNQSMKIRNKITNNLGVSITNTKFWYIQTVDENDGIWFNGTKYLTDTYKSGEFDNLLPKVGFEKDYVFDYADLLDNGFNITDFYLGNGSVLGVSTIRIMAIGITKGNSVFPDGVTVIVDPTVTIGGTNGGQDSYVADAGDADKNFGTATLLRIGDGTRAYLQFNISEIPENQKVDSAEMCVYLTTKKDQLINVSHVYEDFDETIITWNNQPCGTGLDNSSACNLTPESTVVMNESYEYVWRCFDLKNGVGKAYEDNTDFKAVLYTSDADINTYSSKEATSNRPYLNITYSLSDIFYPTFSNYQETPTNGTSYDLQFYEFNVTLNESNLYEIGVEFNGVNYTLLSNISNVYTFNRTNLAAGTYSYYWWAKDMVGNYNTSMIRSYTVSKAIPIVTFLLNSAANNLSLTYLQQINASATTDGGTIHLYRDGTNIDFENSLNMILAAGYYTYRANVTGNQNYTDSSGLIFYANISKKDPSGNMNIALTPSSIVDYGTSTSATASEGNIGDLDLIYQLYKDSTLVANPNVATLNAGIYNYIYNTTGGQNYSQGEFSVTLAVNKLDNAITLLINGASDNLTTNSSQQVNVTAYSESGTVSLFRNNTEVSAENSVNIILGEGDYQYYANSSGSTNYEENITGIILYVNVTPSPDNEPPTLSLYYPNNNSYISEQAVYLNYTVTDQYLDTCELWLGDGASWGLNQTDNPSNGVNYFIVNLSEGNYSWGILCNDSGNRKSSENYTFSMDSTTPNLTLSQPSGTKTSRNVVASWIIADSTPIGCWYNVYKGASLEVANTTVNCTPSSASFSVSSDGSFVFNFYVNDSAGNMNHSNLSFSVDTSVTPPPDSGGGGSGGGGAVILKIYKLEVSNMSDIIVDPGENKRLVLRVKNTGTMFLNECRLKAFGENSEWIFSTEVKGLGAGEAYDFTLNLNVPDELQAASYKITPSVVCEEANSSISFRAEIIEKKLSVSLVNVEKNNENNKLKVIYALSELSNVDQQVEVGISLINEKGEKVAESKDSKTINSGSTQNFEVTLESEKPLIGNYDLLINALSETSSAFYQEEIVLGDSKIGGLAILEGSNRNIVISAILVGGFVVFAIIVLVRIWKFRGFKKRTKIKSEKH